MPAGRVTVTKDSIGGTAPLTSLELPDDGGLPLAEDWRNVAAVAFKNLAWVLSAANVEYTFHQQNTSLPTPVIGPPTSFSGATWTNSVIVVDVPGAKVGDDLKVTVWGTWQLNSTTATGDVIGEMRVHVTEDLDGTPVLLAVDGIATITDDGGTMTLPHNEGFALHVRHRVTTAGKARVTVQLRSEDLTGGAGTATLALLFSARMDVTRVLRST